MKRDERPSGPAGYDTIVRDAQSLSREIGRLVTDLYEPEAEKTLRPFSCVEAARLIGIAEPELRRLARKDTVPERPAGRPSFTLTEISDLRRTLA